MDDEVLHGYLQNHWLASTSGTALFQRVGRTHGDPEAAAAVKRLAEEVWADREALRGLMDAVGAERSTIGTAIARGVEVVGRLKPNGRLLSRSPLTDVLELEALRDAVAGKSAGWQVLRAVADSDPRLDTVLLDELYERAERQRGELEVLHLTVSRRCMALVGEA